MPNINQEWNWATGDFLQMDDVESKGRSGHIDIHRRWQDDVCLDGEHGFLLHALLATLVCILVVMRSAPTGAVTWPIDPRVLHQPQSGTKAPPPASPQSLIEQITGMEFVPVAAGCFDMGTNSVDVVDNVCLSEFYIAKYEVTNAQFRLFRPTHNSGSYKGHSLNGDHQPAVNVSWQDATAFADWLMQQTGESFRLPTEAEWEYAARGGSYPLSAEEVDLANLRDVHPPPANQHAVLLTAPVGSFPPNVLGLHDMLGNASEWVLDNYVAGGDRYEQQRTNPMVYVANSPLHVRRGGSWDDPRSTVLDGIRDYYRNDLPVPQTGFRLVQQPASPN